MLKEIEIQNFRCFEQVKISGFERVNLIGGKNNAGKTGLLEAIFLNFAPDLSSIVMLRELRRESSAALDAMPDRAWNHLFYALKKDKTIVIQGKNDNDKDNIDRLEIQIEINSRESDIIIQTIKGEKILDQLVGTVTYRSSLSNTSFTVYEIPIVPPFIRIPGRKLIESFDQARLDDKDSEVLKAFQIIDPTIESVESFSIGEPTLYLRRKGEKRLPLSLFGDAMNRVAYIILKLVNNKHKILLIDEIENGIHHTSQRNFWRVLFRLAVELDTQIFATTHSLEMLQAFAEVGLETTKECSSAYFELARKLKTNQIIGSRLDLETLNYALEHQEGVRGE
ncbi:AAA family ATPase [Microcoleus vaginatus]|uniref:AAA family ATPase n=1 Tax=Microcoleus vaginatus TaxID=119532 RepID=UPI0032A4289A